MPRRSRRGRKGFRREVIRLINIERREHGLRPLKPSKSLRISATAKARDMVKYNYFNHDTPRGSWHRFLYRFAGTNWRTIGENIARDQNTPADVMRDWMDSPLHRANILSQNFRLVGIGFARTRNGDEYWCQHFGTLL